MSLTGPLYLTLSTRRCHVLSSIVSVNLSASALTTLYLQCSKMMMMSYQTHRHILQKQMVNWEALFKKIRATTEYTMSQCFHCFAAFTATQCWFKLSCLLLTAYSEQLMFFFRVTSIESKVNFKRGKELSERIPVDWDWKVPQVNNLMLLFEECCKCVSVLVSSEWTV